MKTKIFFILIFLIGNLHINCKKSNEEDFSLLILAFLASKPSPQSATPCSVSDFSLLYTSGIGTSYVQNTTIQPDSPTIRKSNAFCESTATALSYNVSPSLPTGLTLDTSTGIITGTPANTQLPPSSYSYTITANISLDNGSTGSIINSIRIGVSGSALNVTCNSTGIATGCSASVPFTCPNSILCYSNYSSCRRDDDCNYYL